MNWDWEREWALDTIRKKSVYENVASEKIIHTKNNGYGERSENFSTRWMHQQQKPSKWSDFMGRNSFIKISHAYLYTFFSIFFYSFIVQITASGKERPREKKNWTEKLSKQGDKDRKIAMLLNNIESER